MEAREAYERLVAWVRNMTGRPGSSAELLCNQIAGDLYELAPEALELKPAELAGVNMRAPEQEARIEKFRNGG